jgi:hypothetical protein
LYHISITLNNNNNIPSNHSSSSSSLSIVCSLHNDSVHTKVITGCCFSARGFHTLSLDGIECLWDPYATMDNCFEKNNGNINSSSSSSSFIPINVSSPLNPAINLVYPSSYYGISSSLAGCFVAYSKGFVFLFFFHYRFFFFLIF